VNDSDSLQYEGGQMMKLLKILNIHPPAAEVTARVGRVKEGTHSSAKDIPIREKIERTVAELRKTYFTYINL
jgi:hypothetical protein